METTHERNSPQEKNVWGEPIETKRNSKSSYRFYLVVVSDYQPQQIHKNITTKSKKNTAPPSSSWHEHGKKVPNSSLHNAQNQRLARH